MFFLKINESSERRGGEGNGKMEYDFRRDKIDAQKAASS